MGKVEVKIYEFDPVIYPRLLWVCGCKDASTLSDVFEIGATIEELNGMLSYSNATVTGAERKKDGAYGVLVFYKNKRNLTGSVIAHESVHVADYIFEHLGMVAQEFSSKNEPYAYLVGWAAKCINEARTFKKQPTARAESRVENK